MKTKIMLLIILTSVNVISQNITNTLGTSGLFKINDGSGDYFTLSQSTGEVSILKTLRLEQTTSSSLGIIFKGTYRFIHNYQRPGTYGGNTFMGLDAGNFTMIGTTSEASYNTGIGIFSLNSLTRGYSNTALGNHTLMSNNTGYQNTALGSYTLANNTIGRNNSAIGFQSMVSNINGIENTAVGSLSLYYNTDGSYNTAFGNQSLFNNNGNANTAFGHQSLYSNTSGYSNTGLGFQSLYYNSSGYYNTAVGFQSLYSNSNGYFNSAAGHYALYFNTTGNSNIAMGLNSLYYNTIGYENTGIGTRSLLNNIDGNQNTALGSSSGTLITSGTNLTCLGYNAQPTTASAVNQITLGNSSVTSLRCNVTTITSLSDARDKKKINDLPLGIDFLMKIKPRQFNWDKREWYENNISDGSRMQETPTAGFIAQELAEVQTTENAEWLNLVLKDNPDKYEATPGNLLPIVVKAIQDLKTENDELKDKLTKFEKVQELLVREIETIKSKDNDIKEVKLSEKIK